MTRDQIIARIQPAIDALVDQLIALGPELVRAHLDTLLGQMNTAPARIARKAKKTNARTNTCRKCGAVGFTARTCGKTHNVDAAPSSSPPLQRSATVSRASKPPPQPDVPPGWSPEEDRREEHLALSLLTAQRKAK